MSVRKSVPPNVVLLAAGVEPVPPAPPALPVPVVPVPVPVGGAAACVPLINIGAYLSRLVAHRNGFE